MKIPKKVKFKKWQVKRVLNFQRVWSKRNRSLTFGFYGLRARSFGLLDAKQIESIRITVSRVIQQRGLLKSWFHVFPHVPVTKKPKAMRMGKGKGAVRSWVSPVYNGMILMELGNVDRTIAFRAFDRVKKKLSFLTDVVVR